MTPAGSGRTLRAMRPNRISAHLLLCALLAAPVFAADAAAPKTKAECKKTTDMKWDASTKSCVKK